MDKTKNCLSCVHMRNVENKVCVTCSSFNKWEATEEAKQEYIEKINEQAEKNYYKGFNGMSTYDIVNKPKHYMLFEEEGIEVRDVIEKLVDKFELTSMGHSYMFAADYVQLMQYLMRFMDKNGKEDLEKARWYLDKMISAY